MRYLLLLLALTSCRKSIPSQIEEAKQYTFTVRHEGLCFVVYHRADGVTGWQVDCDSLTVEEPIQ